MNWRAAVSRRGSLISLVLALVTLGVYWPVRHHEFVNYDDPLFITEKPQIVSGLSWENTRWAFRSQPDDYWRPLTLLSFMLDCQLFGLNAGGHHLSSVALHLVNTLLLFLVFYRMTGARWRSACIAGLFAWHPLHVEPVAWAADRGDLLGSCFWMLTLWAYARYVGESKVQSPKSRVFYALSLAVFGLGLMSKPTLVTLPFVLLLLDYWPLGRFQHSTFNIQHSTLRRLLLEKLPFLALSGLSSFITYLGQQRSGAIGQSEGVTLGLRLGNAVVAYVRYLGKTFWPTDLTVFYPHPGAWLPWQVIGAGILLLIVSILVIRWSRQRPYLLMGWLWFLGTLVPVIGLIQVGGHSLADRYTYLPLIGLFILLVWLATDLVATWPHRVTASAVLTAAVLVACLAATRLQLRTWRNSETLWTHGLSCTSGNSVGHNNLGDALVEKGRVNEAFAHYQAAIEIDPKNAKARYNLGVACFRTGREAEAIAHWQKAIEIKADYADAHNNLGLAFFKTGREAEGIAHWQKAIAINPNHADAHSNLGNTFLKTGRAGEAMAHLKKAIEINPNNANAHTDLGGVFSEMGRMDEAMAHWRKAVEINPQSLTARNNLAWALATGPVASLRNGVEAVALAEQSLQLAEGKNAELLETLAAAYAEAGRFSNAVAIARQALQLATEQGDQTLSAQLHSELSLYQAGLPCRDNSGVR